MSSEPNHGRRFQFSLKDLFMLLAAVAVPLAAICNGSGFWFLLLLTETIAGIGIAAYRAIGRGNRWRVFYATAAMVGCFGVHVSLFARLNDVPFIQFVWEDLTVRGWFTSGGSFLVSVFLI